MPIPPASLKRVTLEHFEEQARPAARRMLFFPCDAITRAHGLAFVPAAFPYADTTNGGTREAVVVMRKRKMGNRVRRPIAGAQSKIFIHPVRPHDFAGVHLPLRIPD